VIIKNLKFSKSSDSYLSTKNDYLTQNDFFLQDALRTNKLYSSEKKRMKCKVCSARLSKKIDIKNHFVEYVFCVECGHLNGKHEDSSNFLHDLYAKDVEDSYSQDYLDSDYNSRTLNIYTPKLDFLIDTVGRDITILDIGCGAGYFVNAALLEGIHAQGFDVNKSMVSFGNANIHNGSEAKPLRLVSETELYSEIKTSTAKVISAIGVIEHLANPQKFFEAFRLSNVDYLYYSVPMFSLSVIFENVFPQVFPRQLSGGHTHLFTERSVSKMNSLLGSKVIGEWRFGTDFLDLFRSLSVMLEKNGASALTTRTFTENFTKNLDDFQVIQDKSFLTSEIHCVIQKS
jgi:SAM-dependent methyltransferase